MLRRLTVLAILALPPLTFAETPPPEPPAGATAPAEPAPASPAAPVAPAAPAAKPGVTVDWGGWFATHAWRTSGGVNASGGTTVGSTDLPLFAVKGRDAAGMSVRQSRLRAAVGLPADGLLQGARLRGLVEVDFMGTFTSGDPSLPAVRLRHAWVAAGWKGLTLTVGQTWGVFTGPYFATSLAHLAIPRFGGAGFLFRRAPQIRIAAETSGPLVVNVTLAALAPYDKTTSGSPTVFVGERSGVPDGEGRISIAYKSGNVTVLDVGASGHYGRETYFLDGVSKDKTIDSWGGAVDARIDLPYLTLLGAGFVGEALGVYASIAPEVRFTPNATTATKNDDVDPIRTQGLWAQAVVTPIEGFQLLGGYGMEEPRKKDLPTTATVVNRNQQVSGGIIVALTSKWRVSAESTWFITKTQDGFERNSTQLELASLYAF